MKVWTVEEIIDLGVSVVGVFASKASAERECARLEAERIAPLLLSYGEQEWIRHPKHFFNEYELQK